MTREEAIFILMNSNEYHHAKGELPHSALSVEAFNMAIEALKERPRVIPVATIKLGDEKTLKLVKEAVDRARPRGEWSDLEYGYKCSACTAAFYTHSNFCPNCGADMRKGGDS